MFYPLDFQSMQFEIFVTFQYFAENFEFCGIRVLANETTGKSDAAFAFIVFNRIRFGV